MECVKERPVTITCRHCKIEFPNPVRQGPDRKFCSPQCKSQYWGAERSRQYWGAERSRQRADAAPRPCRGCGGPAMHRTGPPVCAGCRIDDRDRAYRAQYMLAYTLRQYGLTVADYDRMLAAQDGCCGICRSDTPLGLGRWHIDHDHVTGQFRGLLCNNCNRGIGFFADDDAALLTAAAYIVRHREALAVSG